MPLYTVASHKPLTAPVRAEVARLITDTHAQVTGAPTRLVNVVFMQGHDIRDNKTIGVIGNVRRGGNRGEDVLKQLREKVQSGVATQVGIAADDVSVRLIGVSSSWVMEGGEIMPEPGAEAEWLERMGD